MTLKNSTYDTLKWIATLFLPALGTLYFAIAEIWNLPYAEQVVGTITALVTFLGAILKISASNYQGDGTLKVDTKDPNLDLYRLEMTTPMDEVKEKKSVMLKVDSNADLTSLD